MGVLNRARHPVGGSTYGAPASDCVCARMVLMYKVDRVRYIGMRVVVVRNGN